MAERSRGCIKGAYAAQVADKGTGGKTAGVTRAVSCARIEADDYRLKAGRFRLRLKVALRPEPARQLRHSRRASKPAHRPSPNELIENPCRSETKAKVPPAQ